MAIARKSSTGYGQISHGGVISVQGQENRCFQNGRYTTMVLLQTDAAIIRETAVVHCWISTVEVIGINTVKFEDYKVEGMGYAIPISEGDSDNQWFDEPWDSEARGTGIPWWHLLQDVTETFGNVRYSDWGIHLSFKLSREAPPGLRLGFKVGDVIQYV